MQASEKDENASSQIHAAGVDLLVRQRGIEQRRLEFSTLQYDRFVGKQVGLVRVDKSVAYLDIDDTGLAEARYGPVTP
jgi:hypothetical protein